MGKLLVVFVAVAVIAEKQTFLADLRYFSRKQELQCKPKKVPTFS